MSLITGFPTITLGSITILSSTSLITNTLYTIYYYSHSNNHYHHLIWTKLSSNLMTLRPSLSSSFYYSVTMPLSLLGESKKSYLSKSYPQFLLNPSKQPKAIMNPYDNIPDMSPSLYPILFKTLCSNEAVNLLYGFFRNPCLAIYFWKGYRNSSAEQERLGNYFELQYSLEILVKS